MPPPLSCPDIIKEKKEEETGVQKKNQTLASFLSSVLIFISFFLGVFSFFLSVIMGVFVFRESVAPSRVFAAYFAMERQVQIKGGVDSWGRVVTKKEKEKSKDKTCRTFASLIIRSVVSCLVKKKKTVKNASVAHICLRPFVPGYPSDLGGGYECCHILRISSVRVICVVCNSSSDGMWVVRRVPSSSEVTASMRVYLREGLL